MRSPSRGSIRGPAELAEEEGLRGAPVPPDGAFGDPEDLRRLLYGEACEVAQIDDPGHAFVEFAQPDESGIEAEELIDFGLEGAVAGVPERFGPAPALLGTP